MHAPSEGKSDDSKDSFFEELKHVFYHFPKYHLKILFGDFNARMGRESIFTPTIQNESLHRYSNDNGVRIVNFATSKMIAVKNTETFISTNGPLLMERLTTRLITY